jgi:hypothetical protein
MSVSVPIPTVGTLYDPALRELPEASTLDFRDQAVAELLLSYRAPSRDEGASVNGKVCDFALHAEGPLVALCYRIGPPPRGIPWYYATYSWHLAGRPGWLALPPPAEGDPWSLRMVLVNASDGLVRATRTLSLDPEFCRAFHGAIHAQAHRAWDQAEHDDALAELQRRHPRGDALAAACQHRTRGGT